MHFQSVAGSTFLFLKEICINIEATEKDDLQVRIAAVCQIKQATRQMLICLKSNKQNPKSCVFSLSQCAILKNVFKHLVNSHTNNSLKITYAHPIRPASFI